MRDTFKLDDYPPDDILKYDLDGTFRFSIEANSDGTFTVQMHWEYEEQLTREKAIELRDFLNKHIKD